MFGDVFSWSDSSIEDYEDFVFNQESKASNSFNIRSPYKRVWNSYPLNCIIRIRISTFVHVFSWSDGSIEDYEDWAPDHPLGDGVGRCAYMDAEHNRGRPIVVIHLFCNDLKDSGEDDWELGPVIHTY